MADTCRHGTWGSPTRQWVDGATDKAIVKHEKTCAKARVFAHPGVVFGIFTVVCCAGCRRRIA